ncbi:energy transducer TonB [Flavobacterium hydatis]|jgi:antitoxin component YwqK of YwqJK toxin-antitoxin module|uniref:Energy transducer TonB n=1 Tax=Flavobacterium hydatis TaxID=991 RepID=A0A086AFJ2_FLAHY|nr:energy transducer TonB [Flavobacterium hydatis]KFF15456.1 energy transducer TonB [Flavobacterium hydatis]OXA91403.1 energy transducer TonB [Flavobacterium hydatis]
MKLILRVFFLLSISTKLFSQTQTEISPDKIVYLDSTWLETTSDNYKYIRVIKDYYSDDKKIYIVKDYYKSKTLQMIGGTTDKDIIKEEGPYVYYYENGNKKLSVNYSKRKKTGKEFNWYENGNPKSELEYFEKKGEVLFKVNSFWNSEKEQTVINGNGEINEINGDVEQSGKIKDGFPDGIWKGKGIKSQYTFTEIYENGKLKSGTSIDSLQIGHHYKVVFQRPVPKSGMESFYQYISQNLDTSENRFLGKMYIYFVIDKEGNLVEPRILRGLGYDLNVNAITTITNAGKWIPGLIRGIPRRVSYSLPITIRKNNQ